MEKAQFAVIGLGVMGQNLALNIASKGFPVAVYNRTASKTVDFMGGSAKNKPIIGTMTYKDLAENLEKPRKIMLMVQAGTAVDAVINEVHPYLEVGDILIDGGNSFFEDTKRRTKVLNEEGLLYLGVGVSGGEEGALHGPSLMPGGNLDAWEATKAIFLAAAAKAEDGLPCVEFLGPNGAGHYVKMVHNGIEYAVMQLIAEAYDILQRGLGISSKEMGEIFNDWNAGKYSSYLFEITADILKTVDPSTDKPILEVILDKAKQKGTGKWTSQSAFDLGMPTHTINAAVASRIISGLKEQRVKASKVIQGPMTKFVGDRDQLINAIKEALYVSIIISYAQGFALLDVASDAYDYSLDMKNVAKIWRGGCIIRAELLNEIMRAFDRNRRLTNLLVDDYFREVLIHRQGALRYVIQTAVGMGIPVYALSSALGYFDAYRTDRLPANLIQAQRDYFGAHTYQRVDMEGTFHTAW